MGMHKGELLEKFPLDPLKTFGAGTEGSSVESVCKGIFSMGLRKRDSVLTGGCVSGEANPVGRGEI